MTNSHTLRIEGAATALSSISHGGEHAGTTQSLRRERIIQPDGTVAEIPVISGNSLRGILRDHAANQLWQMLGEPELPLPVFDALWGGGALAKAGAGHVLSGVQLSQLRSRVPMVSLFGCAGGGRIIEGRLQVGKLVPIVAETAHLCPPTLTSVTPASIWEHLQIEEFSRQDDAKRSTLAPAIAGALPAANQNGTLVDDGPLPVQREVAQQMRYGIETLAAGTRLWWWMAVRNASDLELAVLRDALNSWGAAGAHIGGRSSTGHGRLALDVAQWATVSARATVGDPLPTLSDSLAAYCRANTSDILEALSWLA